MVRLSVRRADPVIAEAALRKLAELRGASGRVARNVVVAGRLCDLFLHPLGVGVRLRDGLEVLAPEGGFELAEEYQQLYVALLIAEAARAAGFREVEGYARGGVVELVMVR